MDSLTPGAISWLAGVTGTDFQLEKPSCSDRAEVFKVTAPDNAYYLKVAPNLQTEHDNLRKAGPFLRVPEVIAFGESEGATLLLISALPGKNLCEFIGEWTNEDITKKFARSVKNFHGLNLQTLFSEATPSSVLLHGDMSLPNVIYTAQGFSGFIDLSHLHAGTRDSDLADALWGLQRNLGPSYGELFLKEYGVTEITPRIHKALRFVYTP